jgi:WD40 repeat protein
MPSVSSDNRTALPSANTTVRSGYDAFLSYRSGTDYGRARWLESFLEGIHQLSSRTEGTIRALSVCRDGSDFRLPRRRDQANAEDVVWSIIQHELERSEYLLVLCSPGAPASRWIDSEVTWFLDNRRENILLVITEASDPIAQPDECFPPVVLRNRLHDNKLWYDLRGHERRGRRPGVRDWEDEVVRLAADLLGWDAEQHGTLWSIYEREKLRTRRRQASWLMVVALVVLVLAAAAGWYALQSSREAERARANAIVATAQASADPLSAALMLLELDAEPQGGLAVARSIASELLASAELRGPQSGIAFVQFMPRRDAVAAASLDGTLFLWNRTGVGDPRRSPVKTVGRPVGLVVSDEGDLLASATRERRAITWSPADGRGYEYDVPGQIESIHYISGEGPVVITDVGAAFVLEPAGGVRPWMPALPPIAILHVTSGGRLMLSTRRGEIWHRPDGSPLLQRIDAAVPDVASEFPFNGEKYAAFSSDGEWYALAFQDRVLLRAVHRPKVFHVFNGDSSVCCLAFDRGSKRLAAARSNGVTTVWDVSEGTQLATFDSGIRFWRVDAGIPVGSAPDSFSVQEIAFAPGNADLTAVLTSDSVVRVWALGGGNPTELRGHIGADSLAWASDGRHLATGADVGTVRVWSLDVAREPLVLHHATRVDGAALLPDNRVISVAGDVLREFTPDGKDVRVNGSWPPVTALAASPEGSLAIAGFADGTLRIGQGKPLSWSDAKPTLTEKISRVLLRNDRVLAIGERQAALLDLKGSSKPALFRLDGAAVFSVDLSPNGREFVTGHDDGVVVRHSVTERPRLLQRADGKTVFAVAYDPDGKRLLTCSKNGEAVLHSVSAIPGHKRLAIPSDGEWIETCAFSRDGRRLLVTSSSGRAWLADGDGATPLPLRRRDGLAHIGSLLTIAFSPDSSRVLLTGGVDGEATVWETATGELLSVLKGHAGTIIDGQISSDGTRFMTASHDGTVRLWAGDWKTILQHLRGRTTATLDPEKRMNGLGESERRAWDMFRLRENAFGRKGTSFGPFKFPF